MDYKETVKKYIIKNFMFGSTEFLENFNYDTSFMESGVLDSTGFLELVNHLEEIYKIEIKEEDLVPENFDTIENINKYLSNRLSSVK
ncbi:MAG: acyl carrier protein [Spirochaetes bacterium]|nr:acyl carrier protein [Spirochaetota bacterium]